MAVSVQQRGREEIRDDDYEDADSWGVTEHGVLEVKNGETVVGSYHRDVWARAWSKE